MNWEHVKTKDGVSRYLSQKWLCTDGDSVALEIAEDGFTLCCFSGIPESYILLGKLDFPVLQARIMCIEPTHEANCFLLADYLCSLFCIQQGEPNEYLRQL